MATLATRREAHGLLGVFPHIGYCVEVSLIKIDDNKIIESQYVRIGQLDISSESYSFGSVARRGTVSE